MLRTLRIPASSCVRIVGLSSQRTRIVTRMNARIAEKNWAKFCGQGCPKTVCGMVLAQSVKTGPMGDV